jgi:hypothetical protein
MVQARPARRQGAGGRLDRPAAPPQAAGRGRALRAGRRDGIERLGAAAASIAVQVRASRRGFAAERLDGPAAPPQATDRHCGQATARRPLKSKIAKSMAFGHLTNVWLPSHTVSHVPLLALGVG